MANNSNSSEMNNPQGTNQAVNQGLSGSTSGSSQGGNGQASTQNTTSTQGGGSQGMSTQSTNNQGGQIQGQNTTQGGQIQGQNAPQTAQNAPQTQSYSYVGGGGEQPSQQAQQMNQSPSPYEAQIKNIGGGWYELSDGSKVQGKEEAIKAASQLSGSNPQISQQAQRQSAQQTQGGQVSPSQQQAQQAQMNQQQAQSGQMSQQQNQQTQHLMNEIERLKAQLQQAQSMNQSSQQGQGQQSQAQAQYQPIEEGNQIKVQVVGQNEGVLIQSQGPSNPNNLSEILRFRRHNSEETLDIRAGQVLTVGQDITQEEAEQLLGLKIWTFERV